MTTITSEAERTVRVPLNPLLQKFMARGLVDRVEVERLLDSIGDVREYRPQEIIVREGQPQRESTLVLSGFVCRYKDVADGRRQILELHVPGDFVDLHGFLLKKLEHNVIALTTARVALVPHERLREITERWPHLARVLWFSTLLDASINREWLLSVGRRSARSRLAHLFCELEVRLELVGLAENGRYQLPLTQIDLADATGLTPVHVNRMLRELRDDGLVEFRHGEVRILDGARLRSEGEFDPRYLHLDPGAI